MSGIPRHLMPQIDTSDMSKFKAFLSNHGIPNGFSSVNPKALKPIQQHVNRDKVESLKSNVEALKKPIIITSDGYIVDGHHRWIAASELNVNKIPCLVCKCPLDKFLRTAHEFDDSYTKTVSEQKTYKQLVAYFLEV